MKNRKILLFSVFSLIFVLNLSGISFHDITLSSDDRLLFKAEFEARHALFVSSLGTASMQQLTVFPESLKVVNNGRTILVFNRFGAASISIAGGLPVPVPGYPSFTEGSIPLRGRIQETAVSGDGRWMLYIEPVSPAYGNLVLIDLSSGAKRTVSQKVELPSSDFPARWNPDSRLFVYSKSGRLYYFPMINDLSVLVDERFRMMGPGTVNSITWGTQGDFYYFTGNSLYRILSPELFTRTIYGDFLSIGNVAATLPVEFDPGFDRFYISPDSNLIMIGKHGKGFFFFPLGGAADGAASFLPHISLPYEAENLNVFWPSSGRLTIIFSHLNEITVWRFDTAGKQVSSLQTSGAPFTSNGIMSPEGSRIVFWKENGLEIWDYNNWRLVNRLSGHVNSLAWVNNNNLVYGNDRFVQEITLSGSNFSFRRLCLASIDEFGFEADARGPARIVARNGSEWFISDGVSAWTPVNNPQLRQVSLASENYRVFLEPQSSGYFKNIPMIRNLRGTGTTSIVSRHSASSAFTNGTSVGAAGRQIRIALCFDIYDDDTGVMAALAALRRHNIRATFFLNGDFIRRNPAAVNAIVRAGHETASLFYAPIDFSDARYRVTQEFIARGLARNEDEFFGVTGKELSLLWHPPYYRNSELISSAASQAGYSTVSRTIDPGDWLSREDSLRLSVRQIPPSQIIEQLVERKTDGAVIPVRLGLLHGGRDEYLFQRIEVLLDALLRSGCQIVPVSSVIGR
jgi:peptidoglycan/xylan/chitin deacetylase (PgdA/CDA1 family)